MSKLVLIVQPEHGKETVGAATIFFDGQRCTGGLLDVEGIKYKLRVRKGREDVDQLQRQAPGA